MSTDNSNAEKLMMYNSSKLNSGTTWLLFLFLGWSYGSMEQMGKQVLYYLTLGGFGLWVLYRLFTLNGAIKKYNRQVAIRVGLEGKQLMMLGLV